MIRPWPAIVGDKRTQGQRARLLLSLQPARLRLLGFGASRGSPHRRELYGKRTRSIVLVEIDPLVDRVHLVLSCAEGHGGNTVADHPADRAERSAVAVRGGTSSVAIGGETFLVADGGVARMTGGGYIGTSGAVGGEPLAVGRGDKMPGLTALVFSQGSPGARC
jgi:hypothetical protein